MDTVISCQGCGKGYHYDTIRETEELEWAVADANQRHSCKWDDGYELMRDITPDLLDKEVA